MPEIFVLTMTCAVLIIDLFLRDSQRVAIYYLSQFTLLGALILTLGSAPDAAKIGFNGSYISDAMGVLLKSGIYLIAIGVFLYSRDYLRDRGIFKGEYYVLALFGVLGMMIMVSAYSFLTIYLGLELLSLSLYALVAFNRDSSVASEAAMKYFVLGALASGMLLYGISMLYGATGSLQITAVSEAVAQQGLDNTLLAFGLAFVIVGLAFKLGAVPFHMWLPDVYQGAPTPVTLYIGSVAKIAGFAMIMRLLADGLGDLHGHWRDMLVILAVLSLAAGNVIAIAQTNLKRMLAYSTISHVGFLLLGILAGTPDGYAASLFYILSYALMAAGAFGMIILLSRAGFEAERLDDFKGLNDRSPWFAFMMLILMFSMAGVPLTLGFFAKVWVLKAVVEIDFLWLAAVAVFFAVIGAFYYLRIVKLMYFDKPEDTAPILPAIDMRLMLSANGLSVLALGLVPGALMAWCAAAISW
jgi:NADH-quinone oxidoreductase subunit N